MFSINQLKQLFKITSIKHKSITVSVSCCSAIQPLTAFSEMGCGLIACFLLDLIQAVTKMTLLWETQDGQGPYHHLLAEEIWRQSGTQSVVFLAVNCNWKQQSFRQMLDSSAVDVSSLRVGSESAQANPQPTVVTSSVTLILQRLLPPLSLTS